MALFLDGSPQSSEVDEFIYHEALVHPAMTIHQHPERVLIGGGAEGCTIREVLRHKTAKEIIMVDIDEELVELCKQRLSKWHENSFFNHRVKVICTDLRTFLEKSNDKYDCIILDITAPKNKGLAQLLFTQNFYKVVQRCLKDDGIFVTQSQSASVNNLEPLLSIVKTLKTVFPIVRPNVFYDPFCSDLWSSVIASRKYDSNIPSTQVDKILAKRGVTKLKFYDGITHVGMHNLPKYLRQNLESRGRIITDSKPFSWKTTVP